MMGNGRLDQLSCVESEWLKLWWTEAVKIGVKVDVFEQVSVKFYWI